AIGAIVVIMGLYARGWINQLSVKLAFTGGTLVIFLCIIGNKLGWFQFDKTIAAVVSALIFLAIGKLLGRMQAANEK
ncbi:MAG: hypothetical protein JW784_04730, partial [Candidatus Cloacimonetes bacterium]|nr:hypothetical protein [Candidatus Cloacimonadota bacterium]